MKVIRTNVLSEPPKNITNDTILTIIIKLYYRNKELFIICYDTVDLVFLYDILQILRILSNVFILNRYTSTWNSTIVIISINYFEK